MYDKLPVRRVEKKYLCSISLYILSVPVIGGASLQLEKVRDFKALCAGSNSLDQLRAMLLFCAETSLRSEAVAAYRVPREISETSFA